MAGRWARGLRFGRAAQLVVEELPEEAQVEAERLQRLREAAVRLRRLQRAVEPPGPPERTLSRQAMEQIRHLSREFPEDWPVSRLARGFQVQPDVIRRVLRSRFVPSAERSLKQDRRLGGEQAGGRGRTPAAPVLLDREATFRLLPAGPGKAEAAPRVAPQLGSAPVDSPALQSPPGERGVRGHAGGGSQEEGEERVAPFLSTEEMEALAAEGRESRLRVVRRGRDFFDEAGSLLYRIPAAPPRD